MSEKRRDSKGRLLKTGESQRDDGMYMFRYSDAGGKRRTIYSWRLVDTDKTPAGKKDGKSLRELEKTALKDVDDDIRATDCTVDEMFRRFMDLRSDLRLTTRNNYITIYDAYLRKQIGYRKINGVKFSDVKKLYLAMRQEEGLSPSTVRSTHNILWQVLQLAVLDGMIRSNPSDAVLKSMRTVMREDVQRHALTIDQQKALLDFVYNTKAYQHLATLFTVLLGTGMRIGEATGLRWSDCDFKKNIITVDHELLYKPDESGHCAYRISVPKTPSGIRIIPMFDDVRKALMKERRKRKGSSDPVFSVDGYSGFIFLNSAGKPITNSAFYDAIQNIVLEHNQSEYVRAQKENRDPKYLPKFSAHILRHTFCTRLCENETNIKVIQEIMGHKTSRTTMDIYNEATREAKVSSFKELEGKIHLMPR